MMDSPEAQLDLAAVFDQVANRIRVEFEAARGAFRHPGMRGDALEQAVRRFLRDHLPASLDVSTGIIVDSSGGTSGQLDVVLSDAARTPVLYRDESVRVIPVECAFAVIEVKARLDGPELSRVFESMRRVYALKPVSPLQQVQVDTSTDEHGVTRLTSGTREAPFLMKGLRSPYYPINYFVFAYDSIALRTLSGQIAAFIREHRLPIHQRLDMVCVLNRGLLSNRTRDKSFDALPAPGSAIIASSVSRPLMAFFVLMCQYLLQASAPKFDIGHYFRHMDFNPAIPATDR